MKRPPSDFCCAPFVQMTLGASGKISPCCWKQNYIIGNAQQTLEEAWNSDKMQALRHEFITGVPKTCAEQIKHTQCHTYFDRFRQSITASKTQINPPRRLDLRLNGECNLSCVMCDTWTLGNGRYNDSFIWKEGAELYPKLMEIDVLGGEPLIQTDTFRLIEEVLKVNQTCRWRFVTNANYLFTPKLKSYLDRLILSGIGISHDAVTAEVYSKIRFKGNFNRLRETSSAFVEYRNARRKAGTDFSLSFYFCTQKDNWFQIPEFINYCHAMDAKPLFQYVYSDPGKTSLSLLSNIEKCNVIDQLKSQVLESNWQLLHPIFSPLQAETILPN